MKCTYCDKESIDFVKLFPKADSDKWNIYWCKDHKDNVKKLDDFEGQDGGYMIKDPKWEDKE